MGLFSADMLYRIPALLIAITFHEYAHARMALAWGDQTAKMQGRLTLNPISHLDPIGALMIVFVGFGWARPVPINAFHFRDQRKGMFWVSLAGPGANLIIAFVGTLIWVLYVAPRPGLFVAGGADILTGIMLWTILINVYLAIFNLVPLPPLDGSKILSAILPRYFLQYYQAIEPYGMFILILLLITVLPSILLPIADFIIYVFNMLALLLTGQLF